jgi:hypothetical protein
MFSALFGRSPPATRAATRVTPRLEALDGRIAPGGAYGGVLGDVRLASASQVSVSPTHIGEEIPQTGGGAHAGHVDQFGGAYGGVL